MQASYCEWMDNDVASNYTGELIGAVLATTMLHVLKQGMAPKPGHA